MKAATAITATAFAAAVVLAPLAVRSCHEGAAAATGSVVTRAGEALRGVLGTAVTINSAGVICAPDGIAELAVARQDLVVDTRHERTLWFGLCPARMEIRGHYVAKAGIDLSEVGGFLDAERRVLRLVVPRCGILSLNAVSVGKRWQSDWFCNRCDTGDYDVALAANLDAAREQADESGVTGFADRVLAKRLNDALAPLGVAVVVQRDGEEEEADEED